MKNTGSLTLDPSPSLVRIGDWTHKHLLLEGFGGPNTYKPKVFGRFWKTRVKRSQDPLIVGQDSTRSIMSS